MQDPGARRIGPELKEMVAEASRALALLDADRLEGLARACQALNRDSFGTAGLLRPQAERLDMIRQAREAVDEMAVFSRVLEATRANVSVMRGLRALREGRFDYADPGSQTSPWVLMEGGDGID